MNDETPGEFVKRMAEEKALAVLNQARSEDVLISADTIVVLDNDIIGKPDTPRAVLPMLKRLNGKAHQVMTSYCILEKDTMRKTQRETTTDVKFKLLNDDLLEGYAYSAEPLDKAGAYSIQGIGTFLVESINGSYNNVVGLPVERLLLDLLDLAVLSMENERLI